MASTAHTVPNSTVSSFWECEDHPHEGAQVTFADMAEIGSPICPECGDDMKITHVEYDPSA